MRGASTLRGGLATAAAAASMVAMAALPAGAGAATETTTRLTAPGAVQRDCAESLVSPDSRGVDHTSWTAPAEGYLTIELNGDPYAADWDLATFTGGEAVGASTSFGSAETVTHWVEEGDRLAVQACHRDGGEESVPLSIELDEMAIPRGPDERIALVSVHLREPGDLAALEALGVDVTHNVGPASADVVTYSAAERRRLREAGFAFETEIADLATHDERIRAAELRSLDPRGGSGLPSGRTSYRQYSDYTSEMKRLAERHPGHVRRITLGRTFEGRPIEGLEIASEVDRTDDGRPYYVNVGGHHAREWPSSEFPMEFARELATGFGRNERITSLVSSVRTVIVPVVNVDGFLVSRSYGTSPADDFSPNPFENPGPGNVTLPLIINDQAAYKRKNCRPTLGDAAIPCAARVGSGVDLNRNYGAYWGGPGSSDNPSSQSYRGTGPYSEPESQAVREYTRRIHPTVFISNHTFTEDGKWLRQPGFDAEFLPQVFVPTYDTEVCGGDGFGAITPDEAAMKALGDAMGGATGWTSELAYETLCDITGATEDWNYYSQGSYGYTPEARGPNFHANYADWVVAEYVGKGAHAGRGVREAFLLAGEEAGRTANHGVITGNAPPGATLRLRKEFDTPTCIGDEDDPADEPEDRPEGCEQGNGPPIRDVLDSRLTVPDGSYEWHVNPSGRPLHPNERWTMTCRQPDRKKEFSTTVSVARGEVVTVDWADRCGRIRTCHGEPATLAAPRTPGKKGQKVKLTGTNGADVIIARGKRGRVKARGGDDKVCGGSGNDRLDGGKGKDRLRGGNGNDRLSGRGGDDKLRGNPGRDLLRGGPGADRLAGGRGPDRCPGAKREDRIVNRCE